jgi:hypothetical protein
MPEDQHNSLVTRFSIELIGRNEYIRPTEISNFPTNKDQIANLQFLLKKRIIDAFPHLAKTGKDAHNLSSHDIIKQTPFNGLKHVIIEHKIFGENWTSSTEDLLKWYIGEYWNVEMADTTLPNVSIFISIIYSEDQIQGGFLKSIFSSKFYKSKIIDILNNIASDYSQHCVVLTELEKIKKAHLENWVLSSNLTAVPEMLQLATRLFESGDVLQKYISMASVETELKKTIDNLSLKYG